MNEGFYVLWGKCFTAELPDAPAALAGTQRARRRILKGLTVNLDSLLSGFISDVFMFENIRAMYRKPDINPIKETNHLL